MKIENVIGKGGFGVVNVGTYTNKAKGDTTQVAIKQLQQFDEEVSKRSEIYIYIFFIIIIILYGNEDF